MEWTDRGIVLGVRKHGETSVIAELMTRDHGRHLGLVQGGRSRTQRPILQPGNSVQAVWRARLDEHLGQFKLEPQDLRAARLMQVPHSIFALQTLASHLRLLPERDAHTGLFEMLNVVLDNLEEPDIAGELVVRFEQAVLEELGFGLDLTRCAATGQSDDLTHVSPKSGKAVSRAAAAPYLDQLLRLPPFMKGHEGGKVLHAPLPDVVDGFVLTGYFLDRHVYAPRGVEPPSERGSLTKAIEKAMRAAQDNGEDRQ